MKLNICRFIWMFFFLFLWFPLVSWVVTQGFVFLELKLSHKTASSVSTFLVCRTCVCFVNRILKYAFCHKSQAIQQLSCCVKIKIKKKQIIQFVFQSPSYLQSLWLVRNVNYKRSNKLWVSDSERVGRCSSLVHCHFLWVVRSRARLLSGVSGQAVTPQHGKSRFSG